MSEAWPVQGVHGPGDGGCCSRAPVPPGMKGPSGRTKVSRGCTKPRGHGDGGLRVSKERARLRPEAALTQHRNAVT